MIFSQARSHSECFNCAGLKKAYIESLKTSVDQSDVPLKKRGRPLMLGEDLDKCVQAYLHKVRECGGARIAVAADILQYHNRGMLTESGGHVQLNWAWGYSLLKRMNFVRRKATTSKSKHSVANFDQLKRDFLNDVHTMVMIEEIPLQLILNWDQTGIKIIPSSSWTMDISGAKRVELAGVNDKRMITAVFCGSAVGDFLPLQIIYKRKTPPSVYFSFRLGYYPFPTTLVKRRNNDSIYYKHYSSLC